MEACDCVSNLTKCNVFPIQITMLAVGASISYGSPLTLLDTSNEIKPGTKGDASELRPTLYTAVPAILDRVRDGVLKKVLSAV